MTTTAADATPPAGEHGGRIGRDAFWSLVYLVGIRLGTFVLSIIVARLLGSWGIGAFGIAVQLATLASQLGGFNLAAALGRQLPTAESPAESLALVRTSVLAVAIGGMVMGAALVVFAGRLATGVYGDPRLAPVLVAAGAFAATTSLYVWAEGALQGLRWFQWQARWGAGVALADLVAGTLGAMRDLTTMLLARSGVRIAAVGLLLVSIRRSFRGRSGAGSPARPWRAVLGRLFAFAGPSLVSNVFVLGALAWLRAVIAHGGGVGEAGYYQASDSVTQGLALVPLAAATAFLPSVAHALARGVSSFDASLGRALRRVTGFNLPLCLVVAGLSAWLPGLLFGKALAPASHALAVAAGASGMVGLSTMFGAALLGRGQVWMAVVVNGTWALVLFGVLHAGADRMGAVGAAMAVGAAYMILLLGYALIALRMWRVPVRVFLAPLAANLVAWLAVLAAGAYFPRSPAVLAATCLAFALGAFAVWAWPECRASRFAGFFAADGQGEE